MTDGTMPDPEIPAAITDAPQAAAMQPIDGEERPRLTTHEVDADDMRVSTPL